MTTGNKEKLFKLMQKVGSLGNGGKVYADILNAGLVGYQDSDGNTFINVFHYGTSPTDQTSYNYQGQIELVRVSRWNCERYALFAYNRPSESVFMLNEAEVETGWI